MIISAGLPTCMEGMMYPVPFASANDLLRIAACAENSGYHSVWGNDHMTTQQYVRDGFADPPNFYEILITLSFIAAHTTTLKLGTGMLVTPMRNDIVVTAKQLATLDVFSEGRLMVGVGVGAYREEFEALRPGSRGHRGKIVEESLLAFLELFHQRSASYEGEYYHFENVEMYPKPKQDPLPIYIGGNSSEALERAAKYGSGWMPAALPVEVVRERVAALNQLCEQNDREMNSIDVAPQYIACLGDTQEQAEARFFKSQMFHHLNSLQKSTFKGQNISNLEEINLIGSKDRVIEHIHKLKDAGVTHLCGTYFVADTVNELLDQMERFSEDVMPEVSL